jgi:pimeloyl-ACP methyl ester carboxylesterase
MDSSGLGICKQTTRQKISALAKDLEGEALRSAYNAPLTGCREEMRAAGVAPEMFGAVAMARDLEVLREALGHRRLVLIGQSMGTTVAPAYAALFPGRVEAMVLDAPYPPDPTPKTLSDSFREGLSGADAWCRGRPICGPAGDRLVAAYDAGFASLRRQPLSIQTETFGSFVLNADDYNLIVQNLLYPGVQRAVQPETTPFAIAPAMIAAVEVRDADLAGRVAEQALRRLVNGPHSAVFTSGECRDRPRYRKKAALPFSGVELIDFSAVCGWWTKAAPDPVRLPPPGSVPTLVLAGTTDPITPVSFGQEMRRRLGASAKLLIAAGSGHGTANPDPCVRAIVLDFLTEPRLDAVPAACPAQ